MALLVAVSKVAERVLFEQLSDFAEKIRKIPSQQHGFRLHRGLDTPLANLVNSASKSREAKKCVVAASFNFSCAFDTIDVEVVIQTLESWMNGSSLALMRPYLSGNKQRLRWNGVLSEIISVPFGVRQGSVLGPLIFALVTATIPAFCDNN